MCTFFFISGYFTPTSFDRKGYFMFLRDKVRNGRQSPRWRDLR